MIEHVQILNEYAHNAYSMYSRLIPESEWGNKEIALEYLKRYLLPIEEYTQKWKPIQRSIFQNELTGLPAKVFKEGFALMAIRGGILFEREDFENLQNCLKAIGDKNLVIIQNDFGGAVKKPLLRMKYPVDITWERLMSGNFVSTVLFEMFANEYFVFSESGSWGKYSANDYENPVDIIGFKPELGYIFGGHFKQPKEEQEEIQKWLPQEYKALISNPK
jgi:hypothetical protein